MKVTFFEITSCTECKDHIAGHDKCQCKKTGATIPNCSCIPTWCPLPDAKEKE